MKKAFQMLMTGQFISAAQACEYGLVNEVVEPAALDAAVQNLVQSMCNKSPVAVRTGKSMVYRQFAMPLEDAYDYAGSVMAGNMMAHDVTEGIEAFMHKRSPVWKGC